MNRLKSLALSLGAVLSIPASSILADSISPSSFSTTLDVGESVTIKKTVTVDEGAPTTSKVDVFFLADNTGSMGSAINSVRAAASSILSAAAALGDVHFGVGRYLGEVGNSSFSLITQLTGTQATAQAGINAWFASGGGDGPEANLYGLERSAVETAWRTGSERILVWFGDAPGHDPSPAGSTPTSGKVTEADAIAALQAKSINVQAIDLGSSSFGLDSIGDQATDITAATGGTLFSGINTASIVSTINDAISTSVSTYTTVGLDLSEAPAGVSVSANPVSHVGAFDRTVTRTFDFDVTFTGDSPGTYDFAIYGTVDGGRVATEKDRIRVVSGGPTRVPDTGATASLLASAMLLMFVGRSRLRKS